MPKWEFCQLDLVAKSREEYAFQAILCERDGTDTVIARTSGWKPEDDDEKFRQQRQAIAQLGLDGWQPVPIGNAPWLFQRPID